MRQSAENQLRKVVSLLAGVIALIVTLSIPTAYFYIQYQYMSSGLQYKADILGNDVSVYVFQYPDTWFFQEERLFGFLDENLDLQNEHVVLQNMANEEVLSAGYQGAAPAIIEQSFISDGINNVAVVIVQRSLYPLIINTLYSFVLSLLLGVAIFATLYFWPLRALKLVIENLDSVRLHLEDEVSEKKQLLQESHLLTEKLQSQRDFNNTIFEVASNIIVVLDLNGCFVRFNRAAEEISGLGREDVLGKPVWECVIPEENKKAVEEIFKENNSDMLATVEHFESEWIRQDGGRCILDCSKSALYDKGGKVSHVVILGYDITQRKAAEIQEMRLQRELNQARKMEALGQLTGGIAHDFNNMLGIIIGYSDLALSQLEEADFTDFKKYLENISQSGKRASDLVRQMMVFSRNDPGMSEAIDVKEVASESINMLRSVLPSSIKINVSFEPELPVIKMDAVQLQQIIMNLCLNAKDAMGGEGELDINLGWHRNLDAECMACHKHITGDWLELSVADTGHGMSQPLLERIFEPFFTTKEVGKGTGLGLSMIHTLVDSHQGHILIDTQVGQGTTFKLLFPPLKEPDNEQCEIDKEKLRMSQGGDGRGEKVLVVDDESPLAEYIENMLTNHGYQCFTKVSSVDALALFRSAPEEFSLVITDQTMPEMTGVSLIAEMRKLDAKLPAILMTGYSDTINSEEANRLDISFISKPFNSQALLSCVSSSLKAVRS